MDAKVRDLMTPGPIGVDYHQTIGEAAKVMRDWGVGAVLVVNDQSLCGLVTDRDLVVRAVAEDDGPEAAVGRLSSGDLVGRGRAGRGRGVTRRPGAARRPELRAGRGQHGEPQHATR